MTETMPASEKQIKFANSLGIPNPEKYDMQTLKGMISVALEEKDGKKAPQNAPVTQNAPVQSAKHDIIVSRTEKPHSYEFGKAGNRFKLYFETAEDLKILVDSLKDFIEVDKDEN